MADNNSEGGLHNGDRLKILMEQLRTKHNVSKKQFCDDLGISNTSISHWYEQDVFSNTLWRKLRPVLQKYGANENFINGISENVFIGEGALTEQQRLDEIRTGQLEEIIALLKDIKTAVQGG